ncbi:MAG: PilZ domain-containing protein [Deltaproteobacteria bacterium]|nr:PilZ domain-containing protein [Deltaproteobacteria bacterium]
MIKAGTDVHFRDPKVPSERVLFHAVIEAAEEDDRWMATFSAGSPALAPEQDVLIYFEIKREFMQQPAAIHSVERGDEGTVVIFEPLGDPVSAESRQHYRVSTVTSDVTATIGDEQGCRVVDISSTGFAAVAREAHDIGTTLDVCMTFEGKSCTGSAAIQSLRERPGGKFRYGLVSVNSGESRDFQEQLNDISLEIQRSQLRGLSGAG